MLYGFNICPWLDIGLNSKLSCSQGITIGDEVVHDKAVYVTIEVVSDNVGSVKYDLQRDGSIESSDNYEMLKVLLMNIQRDSHC